MKTIGVLAAIAFLLLYIGLYPVLTGGFVIYYYPYWSPPAAATYVAGGILIQAGFALASVRSATGARLAAQLAAGLLYIVLTGFARGGIYQS